MKYQEYQELFDTILSSDTQVSPYNDASYFNYTKLNKSRMKRWDQVGVLSESLVERIKSIELPQHWIIISEPWCGDAAHALPFLVKMVESNPRITYDIELRDTEPYLIESYLTNGTKSIPKLIVRDKNGDDLFTWGPRPADAQELVNKLKASNASFEESILALQHWYNENKGFAISLEIERLLSKVSAKGF